MKKFSFFLFLSLFFACNSGDQKAPDSVTSNTETNSPFTIYTTDADAVSHNKIRLYPILASDEHILRHENLARLKNLKESIKVNGFHITEKKPYGRFDDRDAVNSLTIQNKSQDTIYLMAGDVISGGKQDRLIAQDMIVPPRTITDISVFCVEPNRWNYEGGSDENEEEAAKNKKIFAFTGYYNVASNEIRKTAKQTKDQQAVWDKVGEWTSYHNAGSETGSYTNLENSEDYTNSRNEYLAALENAFADSPNIVGFIAVSGNKILGADIFNHPDLFKKQYPVLLHAYITDVLTRGDELSITEGQVKQYAEKVKRNYSNNLIGQKEEESKFRYNGKIVHFTQL